MVVLQELLVDALPQLVNPPRLSVNVDQHRASPSGVRAYGKGEIRDESITQEGPIDLRLCRVVTPVVDDEPVKGAHAAIRVERVSEATLTVGTAEIEAHRLLVVAAGPSAVHTNSRGHLEALATVNVDKCDLDRTLPLPTTFLEVRVDAMFRAPHIGRVDDQREERQCGLNADEVTLGYDRARRHPGRLQARAHDHHQRRFCTQAYGFGVEDAVVIRR